MSPEEIPFCQIFIDREGRWYYKGAEMLDRETIRLFYRHMSMDADGRYILEWAGDRCYLEVEDTAFVVRRVDFEGRFFLTLSDDSREVLAPESLFVGEGNVLYCRVKESFPARFTRSAYYQLAGSVEEKDGAFVLPVDGRDYEIGLGGICKKR